MSPNINLWTMSCRAEGHIGYFRVGTVALNYRTQEVHLELRHAHRLELMSPNTNLLSRRAIRLERAQSTLSYKAQGVPFELRPAQKLEMSPKTNHQAYLAECLAQDKLVFRNK